MKVTYILCVSSVHIHCCVREYTTVMPGIPIDVHWLDVSARRLIKFVILLSISGGMIPKDVAFEVVKQFSTGQCALLFGKMLKEAILANPMTSGLEEGQYDWFERTFNRGYLDTFKSDLPSSTVNGVSYGPSMAMYVRCMSVEEWAAFTAGNKHRRQFNHQYCPNNAKALCMRFLNVLGITLYVMCGRSESFIVPPCLYSNDPTVKTHGIRCRKCASCYMDGGVRAPAWKDPHDGKSYLPFMSRPMSPDVVRDIATDFVRVYWRLFSTANGLLKSAKGVLHTISGNNRILMPGVLWVHGWGIHAILEDAFAGGTLRARDWMAMWDWDLKYHDVDNYLESFLPWEFYEEK
jgi:hypothetical protein